jgi:hypothetical protein
MSCSSQRHLSHIQTARGGPKAPALRLVKSGAGLLLLPLVLLGCSKSQPATESPAPTSGTQREVLARPQIKFIQSAEGQEQEQIKAQALTLFTNHDYADVEALAAKYRASKERYASGAWKLEYVYSGVDVPDGSSDSAYEKRLRELEDWVRARSEVAMPRIAMSRVFFDYGWKARGTDVADKVTEAGWRLFASRLQKAEAHLARARGLKEPCPVLWSSLLHVALGLQYKRDRYDTLFAQALQEYPDYKPYFNSRAYYLLPRWYGGEGEWEKDLAKSADRLGGEAGDMLYAQVFWCFAHSTPSELSCVFNKSAACWERVERGFDAISKQFPQEATGLAGQRAFLAAMAAQGAKAQQYFLETNGKVDPGDWGGKKEVEQFVEWLFPKHVPNPGKHS